MPLAHLARSVLTLAFIAMAPPLHAHGSSHDGAAKTRAASPKPAEDKPFGRAGDPARVTRTIEVDMNDTMRFAPSTIRVRRGETIRFVVRNSGRLMHEMVIGTRAELEEHAELMKKFPDMEHDEPHMAHVRPGGKEELIWQFTQAGEFMFGCLAPGHFDAGMVGRIVVVVAG